MIIVDTLTGDKHSVEIIHVESEDFKVLHKNRYFFDWKLERNQEVYKLRVTGSNDILGLVSIDRIPKEWRIHVRLLTVSKENKGKDKKYDRITGNLLTHIAKLAILEFGELACVSLKPKTQIAQHYIEKYGMNVTGLTLSLEFPEIMDLIREYDKD